MGRQGDFVVKYDVRLQELERDTDKATKILRAHQNQISQAQVISPNLTSKQVADTKVLTEAKRANNDAERVLLRTQNQRVSVLQRLGIGNKKILKDFGQIGTSLRRLAAFWSSAALIFGAVKLAKSVSELAGTYQFVVRTLTVLGTEGEAVYNRLATAAFDAAAATGRTFNEAADAMKAWVRQGFAAVEIADLTRTTLIGLNLTELSSIQLVRTLTAQMKAFNIPAEESITILDKLVGVSRKYAIETTQLALGMRRFAAVSNEAGVSLDQQAGLMTAMMVRTQQAAQMVGRAGRTILVRLRRNAVEALEEIAKVNVFTDDSRQSFRNLFDVLEDTAGVWDTLTDAQRANIAFAAAGLRQQEFFIALMEDFNIAQEAQIVSLSSAGLAYKSNRALVDTFQKSLAGLQTEWAKLLSLQSGILDFFDSLVSGLRALITQVAILPEGFIQLSLGIAAVGGAILAVTVSPLVGGLLALASAATLLVSAIGGKVNPALGDLAQLARETAQARLAEARNTEELTRLYIKYFDTLDGGEEKESKLEKTRKGLIDINPELISGSQTLKETYDVLTESVDVMAKATGEAETNFRGLSAAMLERSIVESKQSISDLIPEFQKIGSGVEPDDVEQVRRLGKVLRDDVGKEWTRIIDIQNTFARTGDIAFSRLINQTGMYGRELSAVEQAEVKLRAARDADVSARRPDGSIDTRIPIQLPAAMKEYVRVATEANLVTNQQSLTAERLTQALDALAEAQKKLNELFDTTGEKKVIIDGDPVVAADVKAFTKEIEKQLGLQEKIVEVATLQARLRAGGVKNLDDAATLAKEQFDNAVQTLSVLAENADTASEREAAAKLLVQFGAEEEKILDLILIILRSQLTIQQERVKTEQEIIDITQKGYERAAKEEERLAAQRQANTDKARDNAIQGRAEATKLSEGQIAAARSVFQERQKIFLQDKSELARLRREGISERSPRLQRQKERVDESRLEAQAAFIVQENTRREFGVKLTERQVELEKKRVENASALLDAGGESIAGLEKEVAELEKQFIASKALGTNTEHRAKQTDALIALEEKETELAEVRLGLAREISDVEVQVVETRVEGFVAAIRARDGDIAASKTLLLLQQAQLLGLRLFNADQDKELQIQEKRNEIEKTKADIRNKGTEAEKEVKESLDKLAEQREANEDQHQARMVELEQGRTAGLQRTLELAQQRLAEAKAEEESAERLVKIKERENTVEDAREGLRENNRGNELQFQEQLIRFAGQQLQAAISGDFGPSGLISGLAGLATSAIEGPLGVAVSVGGEILASLFEGPAEDLSDSLDTNTQAIDRNTQTLQDVFEQRIGVPTSFALPAAIARQGSLQGGVAGGVVQNISNITIPIDGRGQDATQIANEVSTILTKQLNIDSRRGFGTNVFAFG